MIRLGLGENDWGGTAIHELSHNFDLSYWEFCPEVFSHLKKTYVLDTAVCTQTGTTVRPRIYRTSTNRYYTRTDFIEYFESDRLNNYNDSFANNRYHHIGMTAVMLRIQRNIGWEPFRQTFHHMARNGLSRVEYEYIYQTHGVSADIGKFNVFMSYLQHFSGRDIFDLDLVQYRDIIETELGGHMKFFSDLFGTPSNNISSGRFSIHEPPERRALRIFTPTEDGEHTIFADNFGVVGLNTGNVRISVYEDPYRANLMGYTTADNRLRLNLNAGQSYFVVIDTFHSNSTLHMDLRIHRQGYDPYLHRPHRYLTYYQWNLSREYGINAIDAWERSTGCGVIVAVIDSGFDVNHEDLRNNMRINDGESHSGRTYTHGTHIAGIIAAERNNGVGIVGVAPEAQIMPMVSSQPLNASDLVFLIEQARNRGSRVVNMSFTFYGMPIVEREIEYSYRMLFVNSNGNEPRDVPSEMYNFIRVANTNRAGELGGSNNRRHAAHVAAPGTYIFSTQPGNDYHFGARDRSQDFSEGATSWAAPHVSGIAALILARHPYFTGRDLKEILTHRDSNVDSGKISRTSVETGGVINANLALNVASNHVPIRAFNEPILPTKIDRSEINLDNYVFDTTELYVQFLNNDNRYATLEQVKNEFGLNYINIVRNIYRLDVYRVNISDISLTRAVVERLLEDDNITYAAPVLVRITFDWFINTPFDLERVGEAYIALADAGIRLHGHELFLGGMGNGTNTRTEAAVMATRILSRVRRENPYMLDLSGLNDEERLAEFERVKKKFNLEYINIIWQADRHPGWYGIDISGGRQIFEDFPIYERGYSWASGYMLFAYENGIITPDSDGNFRPNNLVTEREMITMIVRALGYGERANELGGEPYGYIQVAEELGLFEYTIMNLDNENEILLHGNIIMLLFNALQYQESNRISVTLNGIRLHFDVDPIIHDNRTLVPFRAIFEELGMNVEWDQDTRTAIGIRSRDNLRIEIPIDSNIAYVNGSTVEFDVPAMVYNDRTMVPVRFISEASGANVEWNEATQTVVITN